MASSVNQILLTRIGKEIKLQEENLEMEARLIAKAKTEPGRKSIEVKFEKFHDNLRILQGFVDTISAAGDKTVAPGIQRGATSAIGLATLSRGVSPPSVGARVTATNAPSELPKVAEKSAVSKFFAAIGSFIAAPFIAIASALASFRSKSTDNRQPGNQNGPNSLKSPELREAEQDLEKVLKESKQLSQKTDTAFDEIAKDTEALYAQISKIGSQPISKLTSAEEEELLKELETLPVSDADLDELAKLETWVSERDAAPSLKGQSEEKASMPVDPRAVAQQWREEMQGGRKKFEAEKNIEPEVEPASENTNQFG